MGGFFSVVSKEDCVRDLFYGTDYHSHLGTKRGGMAVYNSEGFSTSLNPSSVISKTPSSLVEPKRFFILRITR